MATLEDCLIAHYKMNENAPADNDELVINGNFAAWTDDNPDGWSVFGESGTDPEVSEVGTGEGHGGVGTGMCNIYTTGVFIRISRNVPLVIGRKYRLSINIDTVTSGTLHLHDTAPAGDTFPAYDYTTPGIKTFTFVANKTTLNFGISNIIACDVTFDNVSIKLCAVEDSSGNDHDGHAQQDTYMLQVGGDYWHPFISNHGTLIEGFEDVSDWIAQGEGATAENDTSIFKFGSQSIKLNSTGGNHAYIAKTISLDCSSGDGFSFWVYIPDKTKISSIAIFLLSIPYTNYFYTTFSTAVGLVDGWNFVSFYKKVLEGGATEDESWDDTRIMLRFALVPNGEDVSVYFDDFRYGIVSRPKVILTFDDGTRNQIDNAYPIMAGNNQRGVIFAHTSGINTEGDQPGQLTVADLQTLKDAGWDISNHTAEHKNLITVSQAEMEADIDGGYNWLVAHGFEDTAKFFAYPYGVWNDAVVDKLKQKHVLARFAGGGTGRSPHFDIVNNFDLQYKLFVSFVAPVDADTVQTDIDELIPRGGYLMIMFHQIVDAGGGTGPLCPTAEFQTISDYLKTKQDAGLLDVITYSDYYDELTNNVPKISGSLGFNGVDDYIWIADHADFTPALTPFSISAWVYMHDATNFVIASKGVEGTDGEWRFSTDGSDKLFARFYDESINKHIGRLYNTALTAYENQWIHLTLTYDGGALSSGIKLYLNGLQVDDTDDEAATFIAVENLAHDVWIGRYSTTYSVGLIDDVMFFNRELTAIPEIDYLYNLGKGREDFARLTNIRRSRISR